MTLRDKLGVGPEPAAPSLLQIVDALILSDDPLLDQRFQEAIAMHPDAKVRAALSALPARVAEGSRITRRAGTEWERVTGHSVLDESFKAHAERFLLEALLDSAESQIRLKSFMAAHAPTKEIRDLIDQALGVHHELTESLRDALHKVGPAPPSGGRVRDAPPVGLEGVDANLRAQVENALRSLGSKGRRPRLVVLSPNALRHLRDQGAIGQGEDTILDTPVEVDLSWTGSAFAVLTYDTVPLTEMLRTG